jgi:hypothetical protein
MVDFSKFIVYFSIYLNSFLAIGDRATQIIYYCLTNFNNSTIQNTCLAFILIIPCSNAVMMTIYLLTVNESFITLPTKIKYFFLYLISAEFCYSIGSHKSFKTRYSQYADNIIITMKVINTMHIMFISLPQILIVSIYGSSIGYFNNIDIASLVFSSFFVSWSIMYYILCNAKESDFEAELEDIVN